VQEAGSTYRAALCEGSGPSAASFGDRAVIHCLQHFFLSDPGAEEALYDSESIQLLHGRRRYCLATRSTGASFIATVPKRPGCAIE
jgi:hypothetical protein